MGLEAQWEQNSKDSTRRSQSTEGSGNGALGPLFPRKGKCRQYVETTVSVPKPALIRNVLFGLVKYGGLGLRDWLFY